MMLDVQSKTQSFFDPAWHRDLFEIVHNQNALALVDSFEKTSQSNIKEYELQKCLDVDLVHFRADHRGGYCVTICLVHTT